MVPTPEIPLAPSTSMPRSFALLGQTSQKQVTLPGSIAG